MTFVRSGLLRRGLGLSRDEGRRPTRVRAVNCKCEREAAQEQDERDGKNGGFPLKTNRSVERTRSRWCVVGDARHTHKTLEIRPFLPQPSSAERPSGGSGERTLAQARTSTAI